MDAGQQEKDVLIKQENVRLIRTKWYCVLLDIDGFARKTRHSLLDTHMVLQWQSSAR